MGKAGKLALAELRSMEKAGCGTVSLSEVQSKAMTNLLRRYDSGIPRYLKIQKTEMPCVVFTDGAREPNQQGNLECTIGGVLFDPATGGRVEAFGVHVAEEVFRSWTSLGKVHPVAQTELYALCVARFVWKNVLDGRRCLFFIDNQGDLDALVKGYSVEDSMKELLVMLETLDCSDSCLPWYCRVSSLSNFADLPSRGKWKDLFALFPECNQFQALCPFSSRRLQEIDPNDSDS